jgi:hypothetical protein
MKFKSLAVAVLVATMGMAAVPAYAADTVSSKILVDEVTAHTGYDVQSTIEIESPTTVFCSGSCSLTVSARFANSNPWSSPTLSLITSNGNTLGSVYLSTSGRTNWQTLTFYFSASSNLDVTFHVYDTASYKMYLGNRKFTRVQAGATPDSPEPSLNWPAGTSTGTTLSARFGSGLFRFLDAYMPDQLVTSAACTNVPLWIQPRDISTGAPKTDSSVVTIGLAWTVNGGEVVSAGYDDSSWAKGAPTSLSVKVCGLNPRQGFVNTVSIYMAGIYPGQENVDAGSAEISVTGEVLYKSINCLKGKVIKTLTAANPTCPAGYSKTTIKPVNGQLPPTTISCVKGFVVKKVTGILPSCPAGYRKR